MSHSCDVNKVLKLIKKVQVLKKQIMFITAAECHFQLPVIRTPVLYLHRAPARPIMKCGEFKNKFNSIAIKKERVLF